MEKMHSIKCNKHRKFKKRKISCIFDKILIISITCGKCGKNDEKLFKEEKSFVILKILGSFNTMNK